MAGGGSLGPSVWAVSDGRAGNAAQVRAVTQAMGETARWMRIAHIAGDGHRETPLTLTPRRPWINLPARMWKLPRLALPPEQRAELAAPWPTVWIGAGRRTAPYSAGVRGWSGGETLSVHILDPKMPPDAFDLLVTPEHDGVSGDNVITTVGSPAYFSPDDIEAAGHQFADLADEPKRSVVVILGGNSASHTFSLTRAGELCDALNALAADQWRVRITASRRTPIDVAAEMRRFADGIGAQFWAGPEDGPNPYLAWLIFSDAAIVTADSANMLSDAAYHALPIHIFRLEGESAKFARLHDSLLRNGCARWFEGTLDTWDYPPLREADRVADRIVEALIARYPQPAMKTSVSGGGDGVVLPDWMR